MGTLIIIAQFILSLSILVVLHELGHFLPAKWFKTKVEKFYLFFDPWFSVFKKKVGETEYGVGWLPLGGYVKIAGMVDESFDTEQLKKDPQPWEFRSKPAWQRLIIMLGGVTVNFILGYFILAMLLWANGKTYLPNTELKHGIAVDSLGLDMGLRNGDLIVKLGSEPFDKFNPKKIQKGIVFDEFHTITVLRNGQEETIQIDPKWVGILSNPDNKDFALCSPRILNSIDSLVADGALSKAGLVKGDRIVSLDSNLFVYRDELTTAISKKEKGQPILIGYVRGTDTAYTSVTPIDGKLGFIPDPKLNFAKEEYSLFQAIPAAVKNGNDLLMTQVKAFGQMFKGKIKAKDSLGGFASIAKLYTPAWDWNNFWNMTAIISLILAFMNLLPIPGLDGGHVVFLLIEVITGRKVSDKVVEKATTVGFILLIALFLYANGLDVLRALK